MTLTSMSPSTPIERVLRVLSDARPCGGGFEARCPAHDDQAPSLTISEGSDGRALLKCHAGCDNTKVVAALGLHMRDLFIEDAPNQVARTSKTEKLFTLEQIRSWPWTQRVYEYQDELGNLRFLVVRTIRDNKKSFVQFSPSEDGRWRSTRRGVKPLLFRLPKVLDAVRRGERIYIVEGEKCVEACEALGLVATCNPGGAGKWQRDFGAVLRNAVVAVLPDNDDPGLRHAQDIAGQLQDRVAELRVVQLPGLTLKGDIADWRKAGGTREQLEALVQEATIWRPPAAPATTFCEGEHLTDLGNAKRLVSQHGKNIRFCHPMGTWFVWDGRRFCRDETAAIYRCAETTVASIYAEAAEATDSEERKQISRHAVRSESRDRLNAMVSLATFQPGVPILVDQIDGNPWLLNAQNGTVDLRTGELLPHRRENLITKLLPTPYDPTASCPTWLCFLDRIMGGDQERVDFLRRAAGYSLTGSTEEQVLFFLYGIGKNGKSTFLDTLLALLGEEYATQASTEILMARNQVGHPTELARLKGARLVAAVEAEEGRRFNEPLLKQLTGGDKIAARFMRQDFFEFRPEFKLWLAANHKPVIRGTDTGIWRRIRLIPFDVTIPESERDRRLPERLRAELPGILAWAVQGCLEWQRVGLAEPQAVSEATDGYQSEMDILGAFLEETCCLLSSAQVKFNTLYDHYTAWCDRNREHVVSAKMFSNRLAERGYKTHRKKDGAWLLGLGLRVDDQMAATFDHQR